MKEETKLGKSNLCAQHVVDFNEKRAKGQYALGSTGKKNPLGRTQEPTSFT